MSKVATTTKRAVDKRRWYYSFGLFSVATTSSDNLIVIFAALVIGASAIGVSIIDAVGYLGPVAAYLLWGRVVDRSPTQRKIIIFTFVLTALPLIFVAITRNFQVLLILTLFWGFMMVAPLTSSSVLITKLFHRQDWAVEYSLFNRITTFGSISGILLAVLWLALLDIMGRESLGMSLWFVIAAVVVVLAAFMASRLIREPEVASSEAPIQPPPKERFIWLRPSLWLRILSLLYQRAGEGVKKFKSLRVSRVERYPDQLINHYITASIMFSGFGLASTALILFLSRELKVSSAATMSVILVFLVAANISYRYVGQLVSEISPVRTIFIGCVLRAGVFAVMGIVGTLISSPLLGVVSLSALNAVSGACWAAIAVSGLTRTAGLAPLHRRGEALGVYNAIANGGALAGALVAGIISHTLGYTAAFSIGALIVMLSAWAYLKL
ncbi:MAG: MFS transporter [Chloroflexi bacterium]|nr:MFS transporter [Chloroflexota bacterium]